MGEVRVRVMMRVKLRLRFIGMKSTVRILDDKEVGRGQGEALPSC